VPDVRDHEELVIKPLPPVLLSIGLYSGLSLPDNGQPMLVLDIEGIARRHVGTALTHAAIDRQVVPSAPEDSLSSWLTYRVADDQPWRAVPMAHVERVWDITVDQIHSSFDRMVAQIDGQLVVVAAETLPDPLAGRHRMVQLSDGYRTVLLPALQIGDTVQLKSELDAGPGNTGLIGLALIEGDLVELVDSYAVIAGFGEAARSPAGSGAIHDERAAQLQKNLWIVDPAGGEWAVSFLVPTLTAAGYKVAMASDRGQVSTEGFPIISLTGEGPREPLTLEAGGTLHRLSAYDRAALLHIITETQSTGMSVAKRTGRGRRV
jgi:two-component system chemotaxis sensor kinase CheA